MKHPYAFLLLGIITMVPFTFLSLDLKLGFDTVKNLPEGTESREGFEILNEKFNLGSLNPYTIVVDTTVENGVFTNEIIDATNKLAIWAMAYEKKGNNGINITFESVESLSVTTNESINELITMNLTEIDDLLNQDDFFLIPIGNGSFIPVPNIDKLKFTGKKLEKKEYYRHSGYPGGLKTIPLAKIFKEEPDKLFKKMVYNMLPKNKLRKEMIKRLKIT